jgi:hypothetical protein
MTNAASFPSSPTGRLAMKMMDAMCNMTDPVSFPPSPTRLQRKMMDAMSHERSSLLPAVTHKLAMKMLVGVMVFRFNTVYDSVYRFGTG